MPKTFQITPAHAAIFAAIASGEDNLIISAVAGSGKTSTIIEGLSRIPAGKSVLLLAFNKRIVTELEKRVPAGTVVITLNAMGHHALLAKLRSLGIVAVIDGEKLRKLAKETMDETDHKRFGAAAVQLCRLGKASGIVPAGLPNMEPGLAQDDSATWRALMDHHDVEVDDKVDADDVVLAARNLLRANFAKLDVIDFDDQLLLTYAMRAPLRRFDRVLVDESQDLSPLQHALVERAIADGGRLIAVGDENQAIYGFRGSDSGSMATLTKTFACRELPLHVSYRCPRAVVAIAQRYVDHIQAHDSAPEGVAIEQARDLSTVNAGPGDMIICRTNAPVVRAAYTLLRRSIACVVLGRDIGKGLQALVRKLNATGLTDLNVRLTAWEDKEVAKAAKTDNLAKQGALHDKAETLRVFIEMADSITDLNARIEAMFSEADSDKVVTCCSIHKSKGLEADRVFIVDFHKMPSKYAKQEWQIQQETNLIYVAVTRAKRHLQYVVVTDAEGGAPVMQPNAAQAPRDERYVAIYGNTYPIKDAMKELCRGVAQGARWDKDAKVWSVPASLERQVRALMGDGPRRVVTPTQALPRKWRPCGAPRCSALQCNACDGRGL